MFADFLRKSLIQIIEKYLMFHFFMRFLRIGAITKRHMPSCKIARQPDCLLAAKIFDHITAPVKRGAASNLN